MTIIIEKGPGGNGTLKTRVSQPGNLEIFTNVTLLAIYNAAAGKSTKKFATRQKAIQQTWDAIQGYAEIDATASPPALRREEAGDLPPPTPASDPSPASRPKQGRGRPVTREFKSEKQKDGTYLFRMQPRAPRAAPGGRRPELIAQLRKRPTFNQLMLRFDTPGDTYEARAFNLATAITCMGGTCGYGVVTDSDGRLELLEPLS